MSENKANLPGAQSSVDSAPRKTSPVVVAAGLLAVFAGSWLGSQNIALRKELSARSPARGGNPAAALKQGATLPDVGVVELVRDLDAPRQGRPLHGTLRGTTVLYLFTSTCPFCARSFPVAEVLREQLGEFSVELVGVAVDGSLPETARSEPLRLSYRAVAPVDSSAAYDLGVEVVPTFILVDPQLSILDVWTGELTSAQARQIVKSAREVS